MEKNAKSAKRKINLNPYVIVTFVILIVYAVSLLLPLLWGVMTSLKSFADFDNNLLGLPSLQESKEQLLFSNYSLVYQNFSFRVTSSYFVGFSLDTLVGKDMIVTFGGVILNSIVYAVGGAVVAAIVPCIVGYLCAKYKFKFSSVLYAIVIFVMVMPIVGATPARITLLRRLNLFDSLWGSLIEKLSFTNMYFLVFFAFFQGIPDSFAEAAEVDGASQLRILLSIMFPMAIKMITTVALILFVQYWNDYNTPFLFLPTHPTLSYAVFKVVVRKDFVWTTENAYEMHFAPAQIAACMMLALPIIVIFIAFKNKLMGNVSLGGVKG